MRANHLLKFALVASLLMNAAVLATAGLRAWQQSSTWISPFGQEMKKNQFLFEELRLSPEQMKDLKRRTMPFRAEIDQRRQVIAEKRKELIERMREEHPDAGAIDRSISEISRLQEDMQRRITRHMLEIKTSLDPENRRKFLDLIETRISGAPSGCPSGEPAR